MTNLALLQWIKSTVQTSWDKGYWPIPVINDKPLPYGNKQEYPPDHRGWVNASVIGLRLGDDLVLVDYDGNKAKDEGASIISQAELAELFGLDEMPKPVQVNQSGDSIHWLFLVAPQFDLAGYKQSADAALPYVDIKRGNQLVYLKPKKIIAGGGLPDIGSLPIAPTALMEYLFTGSPAFSSCTQSWTGDPVDLEFTRLILNFIPPAESYDSWLDVLMRVHNKFGYCEESINLCDEWSARANSYCGRNEVAKKLASFRSAGGEDE